MRTKKIILKPSPNKITGSLRLQITENRVPTTISLNEKINITDWDATRQIVKKSNKEHERINKKIDEYIKKYFYSEPDEIISEKTKEVATSLCGFIKTLNDSVLSYGTQKTKNSKLKVFKEFLSNSEGKNDITYKELNKDLVKRYYNYLILSGRNQNNAARTIRELKFVYNKLVNEEGVVFEGNPFKGMETKENYDNNKALLPDELNLIIENPIPLTPKTKNIYNHRNYFLFQVYSMGMRIVTF